MYIWCHVSYMMKMLVIHSWLHQTTQYTYHDGILVAAKHVEFHAPSMNVFKPVTWQCSKFWQQTGLPSCPPSPFWISPAVAISIAPPWRLSFRDSSHSRPFVSWGYQLETYMLSNTKDYNIFFQLVTLSNKPGWNCATNLIMAIVLFQIVCHHCWIVSWNVLWRTKEWLCNG